MALPQEIPITFLKLINKPGYNNAIIKLSMQHARHNTRIEELKLCINTPMIFQVRWNSNLEVSGSENLIDMSVSPTIMFSYDIITAQSYLNMTAIKMLSRNQHLENYYELIKTCLSTVVKHAPQNGFYLSGNWSYHMELHSILYAVYSTFGFVLTLYVNWYKYMCGCVGSEGCDYCIGTITAYYVIYLSTSIVDPHQGRLLVTESIKTMFMKREST